MKKFSLLLSFAAICVMVQLSANVVAAERITRSTTGILKFQQRLADNGNAHAQYKLGLMYEFGIGTEKNLPKANECYTLARDNGFAQAENRLIYLEVRKGGFDKKVHADWLSKVQKDAVSGRQQAIMLLGQMYSYGIGVKKDLNESSRLLNKVDVFESPVVTYEVERVEQEKNKLARQERQQQMMEQKRQEKANIASQAAATKEKNNAEAAARKKADEKAEKRRHYEEVMRKAREQERLIEEQQAWAEGKDKKAVPAKAATTK